MWNQESKSERYPLGIGKVNYCLLDSPKNLRPTRSCEKYWARARADSKRARAKSR